VNEEDEDGLPALSEMAEFVETLNTPLESEALTELVEDLKMADEIIQDVFEGLGKCTAKLTKLVTELDKPAASEPAAVDDSAT